MKNKLPITVIIVIFILAAGCQANETVTVQDTSTSTSEIPQTLRFAVGPFQPTPSDTREAYEPFIKYLAEELGVEYEMTTTNDWAGIAVALSTNQADIAWMGPWSYVLSNRESGAEAISTVKYEGKPTYQAIILANSSINIEKFPYDAKGLSISFADQGSTSGWLIPTYYFKTQGIDPKTYFKYTEGASHPANEISVDEGHVDLATDYDRNRTAMIESNRIDPNNTKVVWSSDPLPNDPIVVRNGFDKEMKKKIQTILKNITEEQAKTILLEHYTGFVEASHEDYKSIEDAGFATGKLD